MKKTRLPQIYGPAGPCGMNGPAASFSRVWLAALGERGQDMRCDPRLVKAAQLHANWLFAKRIDEHRHIGEGGSTANQRVRTQGYRLPGNYPEIGNDVESVGEEYDKGPKQAFINLYNSPPHYNHLMRVDFFANHSVYGVGVRDYFYVVVSAPPEEG